MLQLRTKLTRPQWRELMRRVLNRTSSREDLLNIFGGLYGAEGLTGFMDRGQAIGEELESIPERGALRHLLVGARGPTALPIEFFDRSAQGITWE